jgi:hypothetical protein
MRGLSCGVVIWGLLALIMLWSLVRYKEACLEIECMELTPEERTTCASGDREVSLHLETLGTTDHTQRLYVTDDALILLERDPEGKWRPYDLHCVRARRQCALPARQIAPLHGRPV